MKKLKLNLQQFEGAEVLTRSQLQQIMGGVRYGGDSGDGECTYSSGDSVSCTSANGNCQNLYCDGQRNGVKPVKGVCCDGIQYAIPNGADDCSYHGGTLCCDV